MNHHEEQAQELEAISYIFPENELKILSENQLEIFVNLHEDNGIIEKVKESDDESNDENLLFKVQITLPNQYPEVPPELLLQSLYLNQRELADLLEATSVQCKNLVGDAMIYTVVCFMKEFAEEAIKARIARLEEEAERSKEIQELEEAKKYQGTRVTPESFLAWRHGFLHEAKLALKSGGPMIKAFEAALAVERLIQTSSKPTGKQLFESSGDALKKSDEQFTGDGVDFDSSLIQSLKNIDLLDDEENNSVLFSFDD